MARRLIFGILITTLFFAGCARTTQNITPTSQASTSSGNGSSSLGVLRSTDHGATWTYLGKTYMQNSTVWAVDPTGFTIDSRIVLYFVDFGHLNQPVPQNIYRATSVDGVNFDTPQLVYTQADTMVDPFVLPMPDGSFRLYVPSGQEGIISAVSRDGLEFTREVGVRIRFRDGGMPGALLLPDNRVRMFVNGDKDGQEGIFSLISNDGLNFAIESGMRIPAPVGFLVIDPQPIQLSDGRYLMLYQIFDAKRMDQPAPWTFQEIRLATSTDAFNWTVNPTVIGLGSTSCIVEAADGTLFIYYVNG
jgi:hypothetical protein